jgi:hypothetical protein
MTLIIQKPTGAKLNLAQTYVGIDDPDAAVYVAAVEAADGQSLETATKVAIHSFVKGCKADGIWPAIKASCILAGARTLAGALVPLVGTAPTNVGGLFVSGNYNRKTGLGDASNTTKYLNSSRADNADPQNSKHISVYASVVEAFYLGEVVSNNTTLTAAGSQIGTRVNSTDGTVGPRNGVGFLGGSRISSTNITWRGANLDGTRASLNATNTSQAGASGNLMVFRTGSGYSKARLAFYSIGESLDLALLDTRVTDLINAFGAAIP